MCNRTETILLEILKKRGISEESEILEFLSDKPERTYDPSLLLNLDAGVDLILSTIEKKKKICIYGDYDADGLTSISIMIQFLSNLTENLSYYIPSRFDEGYGLNMEAVRKIKRDGTSLIITVDCGSVSCQEVSLAKELGMDIIVTDHHNMGDQEPDCLVINPKQKNCPYPFKGLAGCGIAFKLAQGLQKKSGLPKGVLTVLLDLVGIGTIGDIVPLIDENRTLAKYGIRAINTTKRQGLIQLIREIGLSQGQVNSENVAFAIVPHLNSAGRIGNPKVGVELLISIDDQILEDAVKTLVALNVERRKLQEQAFLQCVSIVEQHHGEDHCKVVFAAGAHEGITGIVAGKIKDKYERPTIVLTESGDYLKGTGRSIKTVDIYQLLKGTSFIFEKFGGHASACGFLMKKENLVPLRNHLEQEMNSQVSQNELIFSLEKESDYCFSGGEIDFDLIKALDKMSPFGNANEAPYFQVDAISIEKLGFMGESNKHLRFNCICRDGTQLPCVLFGDGDRYFDQLGQNKKISIFGNPTINTWNGNKKIQFVVRKIKC